MGFVAREQLDADLLLQLPDRNRQWRLRHEKPFRGSAKVQRLRQDDELL